MSPSSAASALGKLGAARRRQLEREPIRQRCREMRAVMGLPDDARLFPTLILTGADRL